jgi:hypothetical protein
MVNSLEHCRVINSHALQLGDWLHHVDVLHRLDGTADDHATGRHAFTRGWGVRRCGSGGQNPGPHWACVAHGRGAGTRTTKIDLRDTTAGSEQLDETLLVSLVHLGTQSTDRGYDIRTRLAVRDQVQRGSVGTDLDDWTGFRMGLTGTRQGGGTKGTGITVGPGEELAPGLELQLSGLQFLLLDIEGSLLSLQLVALCGQGRPGCEVGIVDHYRLLFVKSSGSRPRSRSENRGRSGGHKHWLRGRDGEWNGGWCGGGGDGDWGFHGDRRRLDGGCCQGHGAHRVDDSGALLDLRQGLLQLDKGRASWSDHHSFLNVVELLLDGRATKLELAG